MAQVSYHMEDELMVRPLDGQLLRRLIVYLRPFWKLATVLVVLSLIATMLHALRGAFVMHAIDDGIKTGNFDVILTVAALFMGAEVIRWGLRLVLDYFTVKLGQNVVYNLRVQVFSKMHQLSLRYFDTNPAGRLITRVTNDVEALSELFSTGIVSVFTDVFLIVVLVFFMMLAHWKLALVSLAAVPLLAAASLMLRPRIRQAFRRVRKKLAAVNAFLQEHFLGMSVIQMFHQEDRKAAEFDVVHGEFRDENYRAIRIQGFIRPAVTVLLAIGTGLLLAFAASRFMTRDPSMTLGTLFAFLFWFRMFHMPISDIAQKYQLIQTAMASSERLFKLLDEEEIIEEREKPLVVDTLKGRIEFRDVSFEYNPGEPVLRNVSFTIEPGESAALVGATGAGKSTIVNLIFRFYDVSVGQVLVDGVDVRDYDKESLRRQMSLVLQDVFIFSGSVARNIRLGEEIPMERVRASARAVNAHRFIEALEDGYETEQRERGSTLSAGQRQLLSFARALAFDPSVLVLDEATSNVDTETERLIQDAIETLTRDRTSIVVAHRLSTIQKADKIIVLHKGEVHEIGTHQQLLKQRGLYYRLYQLQYKEQQLAGPDA